MATGDSGFKIIDLNKPSSYTTQIPYTIPPVSYSTLTIPPGVDIDNTEFPLTPFQTANSQVIYVDAWEAPADSFVKVTLDTAANLIPYFPDLHVNDVFRLEVVLRGPPTGVWMQGCTGSYLNGVTGSFLEWQFPGRVSFAFYIRWDEVSGSTGSYSILEPNLEWPW